MGDEDLNHMSPDAPMPWVPPAGPPIPPLSPFPGSSAAVDPLGPGMLTDTRWSVRTAAWVVAGFLAVLVVAALGAAGLKLAGVKGVAATVATGVILSGAYLLVVGVVAVLARVRKVSLPGAVGMRRLPVGRLLVAAVSGALLGRLLAGVWGIVIQTSGVKMTTTDLDPTTLFAPGAAGAVMLVILTVIIAPIAEEIVFRGVLLSALADRWGVTVGIVGSAAVFSAIHLSLVAGPALFPFALILGWLFVRTKSLTVCIVTHALFNGVGLAAVYALKSLGIA